MAFGLKNVGATYQRATVTLFHNVRVYVDDMIAKSREGESHSENLKKLIERLRKYQLKLNSSKCTFGITSKKLPAFIMSSCGIKVDLDKIKAIQNLPMPHT